MVRREGSQATSPPNDSEMTRRGTIVRLFLMYGAASKPQSSMATSSLSRLLRTSRTVARWFLSASSPSHSAAMWHGILLSTPSPSRTCSRSLTTLSFPPSSVISVKAGIHPCIIAWVPASARTTRNASFPPASVIPSRGLLFNPRGALGEGGNPSFHRQQCMNDKLENGWHTLCIIDDGRSICGVLLFFALLPAVPLSNQAACVRRGADTTAMRIEN